MPTDKDVDKLKDAITVLLGALEWAAEYEVRHPNTTNKYMAGCVLAYEQSCGKRLEPRELHIAHRGLGEELCRALINARSVING